MTDSELKQKRKEFLDDTIKFYNISNRGIRRNEFGRQIGCQYSPIDSPIDSSPGCAIGRKIPDKKLCKELDDMADDASGAGSGVREWAVFNRLPFELQELGKDFLADMQALHDGLVHWADNGLSSAGEVMAKFIRERYGLF